MQDLKFLIESLTNFILNCNSIINGVLPIYAIMPITLIAVYSYYTLRSMAV